MKRPVASLFVILFCAIVCSGTPRDNIVIISGIEEYNINEDGNSGIVVKNSLREEYEATRHSATLHQYIYYNDIIKLDKVSGRNAKYRNANSPTVFHDDSKICYFDVELPQKGKKAKVEYRRTFLDPAYFAKVFLCGEYPVRSKQVVFRIPASMPGLRLIDRNFPKGNITRGDQIAADGSRTVTYFIKDLPAVKDDRRSPDPLCALPHILVAGYFPDVDSLYRYHRPMLEVDTDIPGLESLVGEICSGAVTARDSIGALYKYVQQTVRYVAYEEGEAGYRPDAPAEVLRKKFGDCKGMALLLATLIKATGREAYVAAIGTRSIPFDIAEVPSLAATNHMICVTDDGHGILYLDATNEYIPVGHIPYFIQGKDVMIYKGAGYEMQRVPELPPSASADSVVYDYKLTDEGLAGYAERRLSGDMEEYIMDEIHSLPLHLQADAMARALIPASKAAIDMNKFTMGVSEDGSAVLAAPILNRVAVVESDDAIYLDLNTVSDPFTERVDIDDRENGYALPMVCKIVRKAVVTLPEGYSVTYLPDSYDAECRYAKFSCRFALTGRKVTMVKAMEILDPAVPLEGISEWNSMLGAWNDACNRQIEIVRR